MTNNELPNKSMGHILQAIVNARPDYMYNNIALCLNTWAMQAKQNKIDIELMTAHEFMKHIVDNSADYSNPVNIIQAKTLVSVKTYDATKENYE